MSSPAKLARYGVRIANEATDSLGEAAETLQLLGYAVVNSGLDANQLDRLRNGFDGLRLAAHERHGAERLRKLGEADLVRCPLGEDTSFLSLATNHRILALCEQLIGPGFVLNQQNGIVNPAGVTSYSQSAFHRDLPYQHFTSSRPLAINALFCLDPFTVENGATLVIPASHKQEAFPSEAVIAAHSRQIEAPAGSFLVLDAMTYHCGGLNRSPRDRRAVNHLYTIAMMRQQIDLVAHLGEGFSEDPAVRQLLGFNHPLPRSVAEFIAQRERRQSS
ncbi:MAG: phytanoyl-CoA dioxygenase family protein [Rubritepida sp.]|nr:phytanoyl-CoA dioxygenase family protein [Rubritepida sp.]